MTDNNQNKNDNNGQAVVDNQAEREQTAQELAEILQVRRNKLDQLVSLGQNPFEKVKYDLTHRSAQIVNNFEQFEGCEVSVAGRIMSKRLMGKASFCHILDTLGVIQLYVRLGDVEDYEQFKSFDIGDIIGCKGKVFKTRMGEISIHATHIELLSKSLLPLPEKFHGLKDTDTRYRQRYVDLIVSPEVKKVFVLRSNIIRTIRSFLDSKDFVEVETPILNTIAGGASARPFITHHNTLNIDMYLRVAPELYLKRLIVGGFERVYEIGRNFRNEGMDVKHNPEFTMLELYQAYADYHDMMDLVCDIYTTVADKCMGTRKISFEGNVIDLDNWQRLSMVEAVKQFAGADFSALDDKQAVEVAKGLGVELQPRHNSWGHALFETFDQLVEEKLIQPCFIYDYPIEVSPLAKKKPTDNRLTERFEFFICGREMGNAFSELNDPIDQKSRFEQQVKEKAKGDDEAQMADDDYVTALEYGLPPTGGLGIGIDRMIMFFADCHSIRDVLLFPTMKPIK